MITTAPSEDQCSQSKCKATLAVDYEYRTCEKCRNISRVSMQKKRKRETGGDEGRGSDSELAPNESKKSAPIKFEDNDALMEQLTRIFRTTEQVSFHGCYDTPVDPLVSDKDRVTVTAHNVWKATGYRFRVKDNPLLTRGYKARYWCCQDEDRKQKSRHSQREGVYHQDALGMQRYKCKSRMNISCQENIPSRGNTRTVTIWLEHHLRHRPYHDEMPQ